MNSNKCTPDNCPFGTTSDGVGRPWGLSPEGWESARKNHIENHVGECPTCRRPFTNL